MSEVIELGSIDLGSRPSKVNLIDVGNRDPIELRWEHVTYKLETMVQEGKKKVKKEKTILDDVSGITRPGEILAIMGPSGAGKTTMLDLLAGRLEGGTVTGTVTMNGCTFDKAHFKKISGYVMQTERMLPHLTCKETLTYAARMKLPKSMSNQAIDERVTNIIRSLSLVRATNTKVGNEEIKGMSGGERRRLTIGIELVKYPGLLFLDEPTTGLDSFTAQTVMETLVELARQGFTLVCTIHQPRHTIYQLFDKLLLLVAGKPVFFGPANIALEAFIHSGFPPPAFTNPADHFMDVCTLDSRTPELKRAYEERLEILARDYREKEEHGLPGAYDLSHENGNRNTSVSQVGTLPQIEDASYWRTLLTLFDRSFKSLKRDKATIIVKTIISICFGLILGSAYYRIGGGLQGIQDRLGLFFFIIIYELVMGFFTVDGVFPKERLIFNRERATGTYSVSSYYFSRTLVDLPFSFVYTLIFCGIAYPMIGLYPSASRFFTFFVIVLFTLWVSEAFGIAFSTCFKLEAVSALVRSLSLMILVLLGGYYTNAANTPVWIGWVRYLSYIWYSYNAMVINEFTGLDLSCNNGNATCVIEGSTIIEALNAPYSTVWLPIIVLLIMIVGLRFISFLGLKFVRPVATE